MSKSKLNLVIKNKNAKSKKELNDDEFDGKYDLLI